MIDADVVEKARQALEPLTQQEAARLGRESPNAALLDQLKPIILAARQKRHSWKRIAESLKTAGVSVTGETVRRHVAGGTSKKKAAHKAASTPKSADSGKGKTTPQPPKAQPEASKPTPPPKPQPAHQGATRRPNI